MIEDPEEEIPADYQIKPFAVCAAFEARMREFWATHERPTGPRPVKVQSEPKPYKPRLRVEKRPKSVAPFFTNGKGSTF